MSMGTFFVTINLIFILTEESIGGSRYKTRYRIWFSRSLKIHIISNWIISVDSLMRWNKGIKKPLLLEIYINYLQS